MSFTTALSNSERDESGGHRLQDHIVDGKESSETGSDNRFDNDVWVTSTLRLVLEMQCARGLLSYRCKLPLHGTIYMLFV